MVYEERGEAASLYASCMVYMIISQTRRTMVLLLGVVSEKRRRRRRPSTSGSQPWEKNPESAQNAKIRSDGT